MNCLVLYEIEAHANDSQTAAILWLNFDQIADFPAATVLLQAEKHGWHVGAYKAQSFL